MNNNFKKIISTILLCSPIIAEANVYIGMSATGSLVKQKSGKTDYTKIFNEKNFEEKKDSFDNLNKSGAGADFRLGYKFNNPLRIELMFSDVPDLKGNDRSFKDNSKKTLLSFESSSNIFMANFYYDFHNESDFTPWAMIGVGISYNKLAMRVHNTKYTENKEINLTNSHINSKNDFSYSIGLGSSYKLTEQIFVDAGIRYVNRGSASINIIEKNKYEAKHSIKLDSIDAMLGIIFNF